MEKQVHKIVTEDERKWNLYFEKFKILILKTLKELGLKDDGNISEYVFKLYKNLGDYSIYEKLKKTMGDTEVDVSVVFRFLEELLPVLINNTGGKHPYSTYKIFFEELTDEEIKLLRMAQVEKQFAAVCRQEKLDKIIDFIFAKNELLKKPFNEINRR